MELLGLLEKTVARAADGLEGAEHAYTAEQADDAPVRARRDASADSVRVGLLQVKDLLSGYLGAPAQKTYGVEGDLPSTPDALFTAAKNTQQFLAKTPASATGPLDGFSTTAALAFLETLTGALGSALADIDKESRELKDHSGSATRS